MNCRWTLAMALVVCVSGALPIRVPAEETPQHHSLSEYSYLIGTWKCVATSSGKPPATYSTTIRWMYPQHTVIDQHIATAKGEADFMLTYDRASDSFKGIFVESAGDVGVWENPGPIAGGWTEFGYDFKGDNLVPSTRATFSGVTPTHYAFRFWNVVTRQDPGTLIEADECTKG
ncbi:MAG TPA: hypothetical protein VK660_07925 [Xanthomonadaceae bacterium]|jgi:hypothetical protein|nr:hypothetical protein [Xanthomonadaceae bacterium]